MTVPAEPQIEKRTKCPRAWCRNLLHWDDAKRAWTCFVCGWVERR